MCVTFGKDIDVLKFPLHLSCFHRLRLYGFSVLSCTQGKQRCHLLTLSIYYRGHVFLRQNQNYQLTYLTKRSNWLFVVASILRASQNNPRFLIVSVISLECYLLMKRILRLCISFRRMCTLGHR